MVVKTRKRNINQCRKSGKLWEVEGRDPREELGLGGERCTTAPRVGVFRTSRKKKRVVSDLPGRKKKRNTSPSWKKNAIDLVKKGKTASHAPKS